MKKGNFDINLNIRSKELRDGANKFLQQSTEFKQKMLRERMKIFIGILALILFSIFFLFTFVF
jgi:hypothetical protein